MEESIGYKALFPPEEWAELDFAEVSETEEWCSPEDGQATRLHDVDVCYPPGQYEGNEERYELECNICDYIGAAGTLEEAQAIARLHKAFVATLAEKWSVDR